SRVTHPAAFLGPRRERDDRLGETCGISRQSEQSGLAVHNDLDRSPLGRRDDGDTEGLRLQAGKRKRLRFDGREYEDIELRVDLLRPCFESPQRDHVTESEVVDRSEYLF